MLNFISPEDAHEKARKRYFRTISQKHTAERILDFLEAYWMEHKYAPTISEIQKGLGYGSSSTVHMYIDRMISAGFIETDAKAGSTRALRIPGMRVIMPERDPFFDRNDMRGKLS